MGWEKGWFEARLGKSERDSRFYFFLFFSLNYFTVARARVLFLLFSQTTEEKRGGGKNKKKGKKDSRTYEKCIKDRYANFNLYKLGLDTIDRN